MPILNRTELYKYLWELRPASSPKTIQGKVSGIYSLYQIRHGPSTTVDTDWFKNYDEVLEAVRTKPDSSRGWYLSSAAFLNNDARLPKGQVLEDPIHVEIREQNKKQLEHAESGEMTKRQKDNWMEYEKVVELWNKLFENAKELFRKPELKKMELRELTEFMALTLTAGIFFPPRRSEWVEVKWQNYDPEKDNYLDLPHNRFVLNTYKVSKYYGKHYVEFPEEFREIVVKFIEKTKMRKNLTDVQATYLITNTDGGKLTESTLATTLNRVFGKNISTTMLRHIYKTYQYESIPSLKQMREDAEKMGHGLLTSLQYIKKRDV